MSGAGGPPGWADALRAQRLPPESLREILESLPGLCADDPVVLAGSFADGFASPVSDIDICAVAGDREPEASPQTQIAAVLGGRAVDITMVSAASVGTLLDRLSELARGGFVDHRLAESFAPDDRLLLHRLASGLPVQGHAALAAIRARIGTGLVRQKHLCALAMVKRRQVTAEALAGQGDWRELLFVARDIADSSADLLLAAAGDTSLALKWRLRRLAGAFGGGAPADAAASADPLRGAAESYLLHSTFPAAPDADSASGYASAAIGWSRRALLYSQCRLAGEEALLRPVRLPEGLRPPPLRLDVHLAFAGGRFGVRRLRGPDPAWEVSAEAAATLCAFDGSEGWDSPGAAIADPALVERLSALLRRLDYLAAPPSPDAVRAGTAQGPLSFSRQRLL